jgi:hypothetical protein
LPLRPSPCIRSVWKTCSGLGWAQGACYASVAPGIQGL